MRTSAHRACVFAAAAVALFATACSPPRPPTTAPLAAVSPLPAPSPSGMVASFSPTGEAGTLAQILVRFSGDLIPLERLESPDEAAVLAHFSIEPALPGRFRFLTPRMIGFEADRAWPPATRVRVTVTKGLHDVRGRSLDDDLAWTFQTPAIELGGLPGQKSAADADSDESTPAPQPLHPTITVTSNAALDVASLASHASIRAHGDANASPIPLVVPPDTGTPTTTPTAAPEAQFDPSQQTQQYALVPQHDLAKGTRYDIAIAPGVLPRDGNLPTSYEARGTLTTYSALRFAGMQTTPGRGRFTTGQPVLAFSTPIDPKSVWRMLLAPAPPPGATPFAVLYDGRVAVNTSLLAPQTSYTVTIGPALTDTFGQKLGAAQAASFRTGDFSSDVWAPDGTNVFPANRDVRLNVIAVNAPPARATFRALRPPDVVLNDDPSSYATSAILGDPSSWPAFDATGPHNVVRTIEVPLRAKLGAAAGALAYGVTATLPGRREPFIAAGVVQLTNLGVFAQWFPDDGVVRVHRISDGTPVGAAHVEVFPSQADAETKSAPIACATATTDAAGVARFARPSFARCAATDKGDNSAPSFVTIVRAGPDWTYVRSNEGSGAYGGDFYNGWSSATPIERGTIFSDRSLYQPGETAQVTAVGWFLVDGVLRRGAAPQYALTLEYPNGEKHDLGRRSLDAFGEFTLPIALPANAPLGYYTLHAAAGNGETISGTLRVAEFKPPNFKVDLALDRDTAERGATVTGTAMNAYLFGAPLTGASTAFAVTRSPASFTPKNRDAFTFGKQWFWPEQQPDASTDVLQTTVTVDANGRSAVSVPVATDLPFAMTYEVDAETTDASNIAVADSKTFTALPSDTLIGLKADDVGNAGTPLSVAVIATDPSGAAKPGTGVHVELQRADYATATQIVEGSEQAVQSVSYATVASADATSADKPVNVALTPTKPGTYRVRATPSGAQDDAAETDALVYVGGGGEGVCYARDPNLLTVKLDKTTYKPGDAATVLVQSPFPSAELHVQIVRHGVLWETTQQTTSAAPTVKFTITPEMLPNAVVQAIVVRRGPLPAKALADGGNALARTGFAPFDVALGGRYVTTTVRPQTGVLQPTARQTVHVHVADAAHRPVQGAVTLMVVNDAVLNLTGYRPPDLVKTVYAEQPISTRYSDSRTQLVINTLARPTEKGWGFGGGLSGEEADPRVRRKFSPLAYFAGSLRTNTNGDATATFTLPDDLTTWRVMAVAASADGRFGNGESTFRTTKPLVANPVVPLFARPGDRFDAGVSITNGTGASGNVRVDASLSGPLAFLVNDKPAATTMIETALEHITKAYRFPVIANGTGTATAMVKVRGAGTGDAFAIPVPVRILGVSESVVQTGATQTSASVGLIVASDTPRDAGGVEVDLASSLIPEVTVTAQQVLQGDEALTLSAASRLATASDLLILSTRSGSDVSASRTRATAEIANLAGLARKDGGFAPFRRAEQSDPWDSMSAVSALARAHDAGIDAATPLLARARTYAVSVLDDPTKYADWCKSEPCTSELRLAALVALWDAGDHRTEYLSDIDAQRARLCFADQVRLARLLSQAPGYRAAAASLSKTIEQAMYQTGRGAVVNLPSRYSWFDRPVVAQAETLRLELVRHANTDTLDGLTRSLLSMRRNGSFGCACENAAALNALVDVAARETPANFTATGTIAGKQVVQQTFNGAKNAERTANVPMRALTAGHSEVGLAKNGTGTLHYAVTYTYRLAGNAPGRISGLRITRVVREANATPVLATMGLLSPTQSLSLPAAHVFDVELQIIADHPVERVFITDPLPAGFEAVDTSFATTSKALKTPDTDWKIGDQQIRVDRIEAYADSLDAGIYRLHYLARSVTPGTFTWPGAEAHLIDRPDEFGRSATSVVLIE